MESLSSKAAEEDVSITDLEDGKREMTTTLGLLRSVVLWLRCCRFDSQNIPAEVSPSNKNPEEKEKCCQKEPRHKSEISI